MNLGSSAYFCGQAKYAAVKQLKIYSAPQQKAAVKIHPVLKPYRPEPDQFAVRMLNESQRFQLGLMTPSPTSVLATSPSNVVLGIWKFGPTA
ncbi:MAG: hypothetical protein IH908_11005 [Proteobacteria bacterium]|nr:hypothetical protein [Pseudomonadota bacterium]